MKLITAKTRDLGGFTVGRVLPAIGQKTVGPFIFLDHMGPAHFPPGEGMDVRPHPHIGLATVTYLLKGTITHRDSLGYVQEIKPGDINWMTAGRGIVHSERVPPQMRDGKLELEGLQIWVALPKEAEDMEPNFTHHPALTLPTFQVGSVSIRLLAGDAFGQRSPVRTYSPLCYFEAQIPQGTELVLPADDFERGVYLVQGSLDCGNQVLTPRHLLVSQQHQQLVVRALESSTCFVLGGLPLAEPRLIWWNFVASDQARIERAKDDWRNGRFAKVPGETEWIPLPSP